MSPKSVPLKPSMGERLRERLGHVAAVMSQVQTIVMTRSSLHVAAGVVFAASVMGMCVGATRYAHGTMLVGTKPVKVVLKDTPQWMSPALVKQITDAVSSPTPFVADDRRAVEEVAGKMSAHPWVAKVGVARRVYTQSPGDVIEVSATYRTPAALVRDGDNYWMVDQTGVKLPEKFAVSEVPTVVVSRDRTLNFRIITGVAAPAPAAGSKWVGDDVQAGLELAALLARESFTDEIVVIDVDNFSARRQVNLPQIVLKTRYDTMIGWGRPVNARDFFAEISPDQKMLRLQEFKSRTGRVDAERNYIDIRFDTPFAMPSKSGNPVRR
jgi:hypothetical protein